MKFRIDHLFTALVLAAFAFSPALVLRLKPHEYEGGYSRDRDEVERRNESAIAMILGEVRANFSDLMFIKTERYMHSGVAYDAHLDMAKMASSGEVEAKDGGEAEERVLGPHEPEEDALEHGHGHEHDHEADYHRDHEHGHEEHAAHEHHEQNEDEHEAHAGHGHDHDHEQSHDSEYEHGEEQDIAADGDQRRTFVPQPALYGKKAKENEGRLVTLIREPADDFRGFIGYLERQVKPWRDPSEGDYHTDGTELLPWYRLMTLSDPHNVRAYLIGAWWLRSNKVKAPEQALAFVEEGIGNNPDSFQLHLMRGYILQGHLDRPEEALEAFVEAAELAAAQRPAQGDTDPTVWTTYEEDDARAAMRMAVMLEKEIGDLNEALARARKYEAALGGDSILARQVEEIEDARHAAMRERVRSLEAAPPIEALEL